MPRGRLIFPMWAHIARLDTATMEANSRYHEDWRETIKVDSDDDGLGEEVREEFAEIQVKAQIERDRDELQRLTRAGDVPDSSVGLVVHMRDMENSGYVNADGSLTIRKNDRLVKITDKRGQTVDTFTNPELFCSHVMRLMADIGRTSNLALILFVDRAVGRT